MYHSPELRLAIGLGDQVLEQRLRPALDATDDLAVVAQCLAADQVVQAVESRAVDAVVVAWNLHRLTDAVLDQLERSGMPLVVLVPDVQDERWRSRRAPVLGLDAAPDLIRQAIEAARRGERPQRRPPPTAEPITLKPADRAGPTLADPVEPRPAARIIALTSGSGSPGKTTIASNLAAALGATAPTVLVELDLDAASVAAYFDRDPSRNLCTLAHAVREDPRAWPTALTDELQPLSSHTPAAMVLCGPPKREMRTSIAPAFVERLVAELARSYRYVILDTGVELLGTGATAASHRAALASAHEVLLVSASDLVGLWHARMALDQLERHLGLQREHVRLVLNGHTPRHHHSPAEVAWHLGASVAAVVPFDHGGTQRAIAEQRPLVLEPAAPAARAILMLAHTFQREQVPSPLGHHSLASAQRWWQRALADRPLLGARRVVGPKRALTELEASRAAAGRTRGRQASW